MKTKATIILFLAIGITILVFLEVPTKNTTNLDNKISTGTTALQNLTQTQQSNIPTESGNKKAPGISDQKSNTDSKQKPAYTPNYNNNPIVTEVPKPNNTVAFLEDFKTNYSVVEADKLADRTSPGWWLGSGAYFNSSNGVGSTVMGPLAIDDRFRTAYSSSNPTDTDNGYYPQNIFRLVLTRGKWQNFQQELDFKIINNNLTNSPNRNDSNGLFFFNRYQNANNLYYTGIRVDGAAVIKKKINGVYYDLSYDRFFKNSTYNKGTNPSLLPKQKWISLRSEIKTNPDNTVSIKLYIDIDRTGNWILATQAIDDGKKYGGQAILDEGYTGIRTDFMDVEFDNYKVMQE